MRTFRGYVAWVFPLLVIFFFRFFFVHIAMNHDVSGWLLVTRAIVKTQKQSFGGRPTDGVRQIVGYENITINYTRYSVVC